MKKIFIIVFTITSFSFDHIDQQKEDFSTFLFTFGADKDFQLERIKFPLEFITWKDPTEIGGEIVTKMIEKQDWEHDYLFLNDNYRAQIFDNYEGKLDDTDERLFQWIGVETGINVKYFFKKIEGKWFLMKIESLGD